MSRDSCERCLELRHPLGHQRRPRVYGASVVSPARRTRMALPWHSRVSCGAEEAGSMAKVVARPRADGGTSFRVMWVIGGGRPIPGTTRGQYGSQASETF